MFFCGFFILKPGEESRLFRIVHALNNNVALVKNEQDDQAVVMGLGIVFQKKKGDLITPSKVEKVFLLKTEESKENFFNPFEKYSA